MDRRLLNRLIVACVVMCSAAGAASVAAAQAASGVGRLEGVVLLLLVLNSLTGGCAQPRIRAKAVFLLTTCVS